MFLFGPVGQDCSLAGLRADEQLGNLILMVEVGPMGTGKRSIRGIWSMHRRSTQQITYYRYLLSGNSHAAVIDLLKDPDILKLPLTYIRQSLDQLIMGKR